MVKLIDTTDGVVYATNITRVIPGSLVAVKYRNKTVGYNLTVNRLNVLRTGMQHVPGWRVGQGGVVVMRRLDSALVHHPLVKDGGRIELVEDDTGTLVHLYVIGQNNTALMVVL